MDSADFMGAIAVSADAITVAGPEKLALREHDLPGAVASVQRASQTLVQRGFSACGSAPVIWDRVPKLIAGREYVADQYLQAFSRRQFENIEVVTLASIVWSGSVPPGNDAGSTEIKIGTLAVEIFGPYFDQSKPLCGLEGLVAEKTSD